MSPKGKMTWQMWKKYRAPELFSGVKGGLTVHPATVMLLLSPCVSFLWVPSGLHTVKEHQNKHGEQREWKTAVFPGNYRHTRAHGSMSAGRSDGWVDRRVKGNILNNICYYCWRKVLWLTPPGLRPLLIQWYLHQTNTGSHRTGHTN